MSNHSLAFTRRRFVSSVAVAAGFVVLRPAGLQAAARELPQLRLLVVSDTHLGYRDQETAAKRWAQTAEELAAAPGEMVLHLGDVVDGGREAQYPIYLETRRRIGKPVHEIPGNHDPPELFAKHVRQPIDTAVELRWLRFLLLNNSRVDSHDGFLSEEQLAWLDGQCREAAANEQFVIVAMHVPAHTNFHPDRGWHVKPANGQTKFYETIARHKLRVLAVFHGHFHNGIRGWDDRAPVHEIAFPSALYNQDRKLAEQKAAGYNLPEFRPGFTAVEIADGAIRLRFVPVGVVEAERASVEKSWRLDQIAAT